MIIAGEGFLLADLYYAEPGFIVISTVWLFLVSLVCLFITSTKEIMFLPVLVSRIIITRPVSENLAEDSTWAIEENVRF